MAKQDVPASSRVKRIPIGELTEGEKEGLAEKGCDMTGDFVDVDLADRQVPELVDPKAAQRQELASKLASPGSVVDSLPLDRRQEESNARVVELEADVARLKQELEEKSELCPRCGWEIEAEISIEPTDEEKEEFLKCVCAGQSFAKEYELFGGNVRFRFKTKEVRMVNGVGEAVRRLTYLEVLKTPQEMVYVTNLLSFISSIEWIEMRGQKLAIPAIDPTDEKFYDKCGAAIANFPEMVSFAVKEKFGEFEALVNHMTANADNPKYWRGNRN